MKSDLNAIAKVMKESEIETNESLVLEGWMSEIDAIAQQAKIREEFKKELKELFKGHQKERALTTPESLESMAKDYFDDKKANEAKDAWIVMNNTDGIVASPDVMTKAEADKFIKDFPLRFKHQGFYRTSRGERI